MDSQSECLCSAASTTWRGARARNWVLASCPFTCFKLALELILLLVQPVSLGSLVPLLLMENLHFEFGGGANLALLRGEPSTHEIQRLQPGKTPNARLVAAEQFNELRILTAHAGAGPGLRRDAHLCLGVAQRYDQFLNRLHPAFRNPVLDTRPNHFQRTQSQGVGPLNARKLVPQLLGDERHQGMEQVERCIGRPATG